MLIVDLYLQREAVASKLRQIAESEIIPWLNSRGQLVEFESPNPNSKCYFFRSNTGIETSFSILDGEMIFAGDNTTIGCVKIRPSN